MSPDSFDLGAFLALPRLDELALSPGGERLVTTMSLPRADGSKFVSSLWELDPCGERPPRRLTSSAEGEGSPRFAPDGSLLFVSARPRPDGADGPPGDVKGLWRLPASGEAEFVVTPPGGIDSLAVARTNGRVVLATPVHPGCPTWQEDAAREQARRDANVTALLYTDYPIREWDRWYGPRERQLFAQTGNGEPGAFACLTPDAAFALEVGTSDVAPGGDAAVTTWHRGAPNIVDSGQDLVVIPIGADGRPGDHRVILADPRVTYACVAFAPDGGSVAAIQGQHGATDRCSRTTIVVIDLETGRRRDVLEGFDRWPEELAWAPDGGTLYFTTDDDGHVLPFAVDIGSGDVTRLAGHGSYTCLTPAPDGTTLCALRSGIGEPPHAVALDTRDSGRDARRIPCLSQPAGQAGGVPAHRIERVETTAPDGARIPGWLVLPRTGEPAALVAFLHGGPLGSWNAWHWRWCPHLFADRGWAVLLGDPALSVGYGSAYVERGWGRWGAEPYTDTIALVEEVCRRPDVDGDRVAVMGGSFGGYLANWIAGHTDRFRAIVSHCGLWNMESFHGTTDLGPMLEIEFGDRYREPEGLREWSPHRFVDRIKTPMLVIHSDRDYRVPVSEALALWTDLRRHGVEAAYLQFPDENHWILSPPHIRVWYETIFSFLEHHVLGEPMRRPEHV